MAVVLYVFSPDYCFTQYRTVVLVFRSVVLTEASWLFLSSVSVFLCLLCVCVLVVLVRIHCMILVFFLLLSRLWCLIGTFACIFVCVSAYDPAYIFRVILCFMVSRNADDGSKHHCVTVFSQSRQHDNWLLVLFCSIVVVTWSWRYLELPWTQPDWFWLQLDSAKSMII